MGTPHVTAERPFLGLAVERALELLKLRLAAEFAERLERYVLFGSRARGTPGLDSDVDVLVVVQGLNGAERARVYELGAEIQMDTRVKLAPLAFSPEEYQRMLGLERALVLDIEREGMAL